MSRPTVLLMLLTLLLASAALRADEPRCTNPKPDEIKCLREKSEWGFAITVIPHRPRVTFHLNTYTGLVQGLRHQTTTNVYSIQPEASRSVTYRFNDPVFAGRQLPQNGMEMWIVDCRDQNGIKFSCADALTIQTIAIP